MKVYLDFESYFNSKQDYDLKSISMCEYIRDPRFRAFGAGLAIEDNPVQWLRGGDLNHLPDMFDWTTVDLIGHNIKFDGTILLWKFGCYPKSFIDTKGMSRAVLGKTVKNHSLATLAEHFGLESKGHLNTNGKLELTSDEEKELADYCLHDVELCRMIFKVLANEFPMDEYAALHRTIDMFVVPKLTLNTPLLQEASKREALRREKIFEEIGIDKQEFASNKKFPNLLIRKGYEVPTKVSPSTGKLIPALALGDTEFLEMMETENEELKALIEARVAAKSTLLETRSAKLATIGRTGKWPFDVEYSGADQTHRFSGGSGAGGNPQNFTRDSVLREAVQAPEGYSLIVGDFSAIEFRLVAYLSRDPGLVQSIEKGVDIYCDFASVYYGRKITDKDKKERQFGKTAILGLGYGMGWEKFIKTVRVRTGDTITEEQSRKAISLYRTRYNKVPALWDQLGSIIPYIASDISLPWDIACINLGKHYLYLPSGLKIRYPNLRQEANDRDQLEWVYDVYDKGRLSKRKLYGGKMLENICQGLAGELCKSAMLEMGNNVTGLIHDEIHVICKKGLELVTAQKLRRAMTKAPDWLPSMVLGADIGTGTNWSNSK